ncbi:30S ribosomal protein S6 [Rhodotorula toruloides]|nr:30S ribosomal protein S6 [Rhodotorula toruloides]
MPLYELVCITKHHLTLTPIHSLMRTTTQLITQNGGVVRNLDFWGTRNLPQRMKVGRRRGGGGEGEGEFVGDYWTLRFDASPPLVTALNARLRLNPSVLRWTALRLGSKLEQVAGMGEEKTVSFEREMPGWVRGGAEVEEGVREAREWKDL